jgi:hypothetical protein
MALEVPLFTAQHEAAHVVVGVALGLKLREALIGLSWNEGAQIYGYTWFPAGTVRDREALACMYAAGPAYERLLGRPPAQIELQCSVDFQRLRELRVGVRGVETFIRAASALLESRSTVHARVTRALLEHTKIRGVDVEALARGERISIRDE